MTPQPYCAWELDALLGEGPAWFGKEEVLRFVDIKRGRLHRFDPKTQTGESFETGGNPSFVLPDEEGRVITGSRSTIHAGNGRVLGDRLALLPQPPHNRTNDATTDSAGRLWVATMDDEECRPTGTLWRLDRYGLRHAGSSAVVLNGPAVTTDLRWLYLVNSGERRVMRHALDDQGMPGRGEVFLALDESEGHPDGIVVDAEGCLWVALWDGWGVRRYAPDGTLLMHVPLPCARVTKLALGGPDMKTAYVTTARIGLDDGALAQQPLAGSLFAFSAPAPGTALPGARL